MKKRVFLTLFLIMVIISIYGCELMSPEEKAAIKFLQEFKEQAEDKRKSLQDKGYDCFENILTDDGCQTWQDCVNGTCVPAPGKCVTDKDCSEGLTCQGYHNCKQKV